MLSRFDLPDPEGDQPEDYDLEEDLMEHDDNEDTPGTLFGRFAPLYENLSPITSHLNADAIAQERRRFIFNAPSKRPPSYVPVKNFLDDLVPYQKYRLSTTPHAVLTPQGVEQVRLWLEDRFHVKWLYTTVTDSVGLEENIQNHVYALRGEEYKVGGRFISRLCKILYIRHEITVSDYDKQLLNDRIQNHWAGGDSFWIDRAVAVDWEAGEFGEKDKDSEDGSCWWYNGGIHSEESRVSKFSAAMASGFTGALRLWTRRAEEFYGVGRVWVIRTTQGAPIIFNGYGLTTMQWAAKLSKHCGFNNYYTVGLYLTNDLLVNRDMGVILNPPDDYKAAYSFDIFWKQER